MWTQAPLLQSEVQPSTSPEQPSTSVFLNKRPINPNTERIVKRKRFSFTNKVVNIEESADENEDTLVIGSSVAFCPESGVRLTDNDLIPALQLLKRQFPTIGGLVDTIYFETEILEKL